MSKLIPKEPGFSRAMELRLKPPERRVEVSATVAVRLMSLLSKARVPATWVFFLAAS